MEKILCNGIRVRTSKSTSGITSILVKVNTGSIDEKENEHGIAHAIEHMMFKGNKTYNAEELSLKLEHLGELTANTTEIRTHYGLTVMDDDAQEAVNVLGAMFAPTFPEGMIEKEMDVICEEIGMVTNDTFRYGLYRSNEVALAGSVYDHSVLGTEESVKSFTQEMLFDFFNRMYLGSNIMISIITGEELDMSVFENIASGKTERPEINININGSYNVESKGVDQAVVVIRYEGIKDSFSRESICMELLNMILGGGMNSRLFKEVRIEEGLAYRIAADDMSDVLMGSNIVIADTNHDSVDRVLEIMNACMDDLRDNGVKIDEFNAAVRNYINIVGMGYETTQSKNNLQLMTMTLELDTPTVIEMLEHVKSINIFEVNELAKKVFSGNRTTYVLQ